MDAIFLQHKKKRRPISDLTDRRNDGDRSYSALTAISFSTTDADTVKHVP